MSDSGQNQNEEFKKIEKLQENAIRMINLLHLNTPGIKKKILKLKDFIMLQNMLFVKDCASENVLIIGLIVGLMVLIINFIPLNYHCTIHQDHHPHVN